MPSEPKLQENDVLNDPYLLEIWLLYHVYIHSHQQTHITVSKDSVDLACLLPREVLKVQNLSSSSVSKASINESCLFSNQGNIVSIYIYRHVLP